MNKNENFGLTARTQSINPDGNQKVLNLKIKVSTEFHSRWTTTIERLSKRYIGGGAAIVLNAMEDMLPELEKLAEEIPQTGTQKQSVKATGKGGSL